MNAPRYEPTRTRRTQTVWPVRRPEPQSTPRTPDARRDVDKEDEPAHDEPGYGHGV
jgi:hypothetical protein